MKYLKYDLRLVESSVHESDYDYNIRKSDDVSWFMKDIVKLHTFPNERCYSVFLNAIGDVVGFMEISKGGTTETVVDTKEVFKAALTANAVAIILAHNHPSGDPTPSDVDIKTTERLVEAGKLLDVNVLDHVIIGHGGKHLSMKAEGYMSD